MSTLHRHTRALQAAASAVLLTAAVAAFPLLAAEQYDDAYYADQVVRMFQKLGAENTSIYANGSLETSAFDFAAYFRHTCYRATDYDMLRCKETFGPYANLNETYTSGKLAGILGRVTHLKAIASLLPGGPKVETAPAVTPAPVSQPVQQVVPGTTPAMTELELTQADRVRRGKEVWAVCLKRDSERSAAARCYQQNIRLIMEHIVAITDETVQ